jgi:hypothetical protein
MGKIIINNKGVIMQKCRIDGSDLIEIGDLGNQYFTDFVDDPTDGFKSSLKLGIGEKSGLIQLFDGMDPEKMYRKYWYRSGINPTMRNDLNDIVYAAQKYVNVTPGEDVVLDIACNDGTLLSNWDPKIFRIGIDPARNLKQHSEKHADHIVEDFFSAKNYDSVFTGPVQKAKVITSIAMFYDLPDPNWFVDEVKQCLAGNGVWIIQMSYTPLMLKQNAFDNICHEHLQYYTFTVLNNLLKVHGMKVVDVELNDVNSGSLRVIVAHEDNKDFKLPPHALQIGEFNVDALLTYEDSLNITSPDTWLDFFKRAEENKNKTLELLKDLKAKGKKVVGFGASTKGNTLLQYYGITPDLISCIAEASPEKFGKKTIGSGIPIIDEKELESIKPDYLFIFPWHFVESFKKKTSHLRGQGTQFIVPLPEVYIV